ncbi:antibiotic biosynthesis monooxygenase family protein [Shewanella sp. ENK2]|uniref:antibiotic biosynthesis monooxygenase family protein n=1 Tax=Shewanella sp. ENK2 TaxID=2775245 RepID=UPI0037492CC7
MTYIAITPKPPYYAVVFSSTRSDVDEGYSEVATQMVALAAQQPGFLGIESARENIGITVSYWSDINAIKQWKANSEHMLAQQHGRTKWYSDFKVRIAKVERDYGTL